MKYAQLGAPRHRLVCTFGYGSNSINRSENHLGKENRKTQERERERRDARNISKEPPTRGATRGKCVQCYDDPQQSHTNRIARGFDGLVGGMHHIAQERTITHSERA